MFDLQALDLALSNCDAYDAGILCDGNSPKYDTPRLLLCSGLLTPDTFLGENGRHREVSDDQATPYLFRRFQVRNRQLCAQSRLHSSLANRSKTV
ncbi:MAG: hypothetical protein EOO38_17690 [Cytophagaceae bacterium]|jgi:hypothetical protein|nr:MAG: hypothetical protein EOO38_17690 [Cytophagaceae bacterium]